MNKAMESGWEYLRGDKMIWMIVIFLFIFSMLAVYSATGTLAYKMQVGNEKYLMKQIIMAVGGALCSCSAPT
jgi:cell division protein FtsW